MKRHPFSTSPLALAAALLAGATGAHTIAAHNIVTP
jgi:hypothetical protein